MATEVRQFEIKALQQNVLALTCRRPSIKLKAETGCSRKQVSHLEIPKYLSSLRSVISALKTFRLSLWFYCLQILVDDP